MFQVLSLSTTCQGFKTLTLPSTPRKRRFSNSNFQSHPHKKKQRFSQNQHSSPSNKHHNLQPHQITFNLNPPTSPLQKTTGNSQLPTSLLFQVAAQPFLVPSHVLRCGWTAVGNRRLRCHRDETWCQDAFCETLIQRPVWWEQRSADLEKTTNPYGKSDKRCRWHRFWRLWMMIYIYIQYIRTST